MTTEEKVLQDKEIDVEHAVYPEAVWVSQGDYNRVFNALSPRGLVNEADIPGGWVGMYLLDGKLIRVDPRMDNGHEMDELVASLSISPEVQAKIDAIWQKAKELVDIFVGTIPAIENNKDARLAFRAAVVAMTVKIANS